MPADRKRKVQPLRVDDFAGAFASEQLSFKEVLLTPPASRDGLQRAGCALVSQQSFEDVDRGCKRWVDRTILRFAVPTAVLELLAKQASDDGFHILVEVSAQGD